MNPGSTSVGGGRWGGWFWIVPALLLLMAAKGGPDYVHYLSWGRAFARGDLGVLESETLSPQGVPVLQWSHGTGLYYALAELFPRAVSGPAGDFRLLGWLAALATWISLSLLVAWRLKGDSAGCAVILGASFLGTHFGVYSVFHASESLTFGLLGLLLVWAIGPRRRTDMDRIVFCVLAGLLAIVRIQNLIYVAAAMAMAWRRFVPDANGSRGRWAMAGLGVVLALAMFHVLQGNYWMTGRLLRSPYAFGDAGFSSVDLLHPLWLTVLVHPWHGLLVYHPLYALGLAAAVGQVAAPRDAGERWDGWIGVAVLVVAVYLQAAWYCWWQGEGSFGMRGFGPAGFFAILPIASLWGRCGERVRCRWVLAVFLVAAAAWSSLLMWQGHTNWYTWRTLLGGQMRTMVSMSWWGPAVVSGIALASLMWRGRERDPFRLMGALLWAGAFVYLAGAATSGWAVGTRLGGVTVAGVALACSWLAWVLVARAEQDVRWWDRARPWVGGGMLALFVAMNLLFVRTAVHEWRATGRDGRVGAGSQWQAPFDVAEAFECLAEYRRVPGFEGRKRRLESFLAPFVESRVGGEAGGR